ncbi:MAG TPA: hypothetical protein VMU33_07030 [Burkholderiaceae bacterium]|nr:hypothetical protein [Burkholderiaceae bacterium]
MAPSARSCWRRGAVAAACLAAGAAFAQEPRDHAIPSCYEQLRDFAPRETTGDLTVIVDQTTFLDARMRQIIHETVDRLVRPGTRISIAVFSAYVDGRYLDVLASGQTETAIDAKQRDFVPKRELRQNDQCLADQLAFAHRLVAKTLDAAFAGIDPNIVRSDILAALRDIGRRVAEAPSGNRMVIVVSDMLENSSITSFYQGSRLRDVDPKVELKKTLDAGVRADFAGARVVVIGAGIVSDKATDGRSYRDPRAMLDLEDFWRRWFAASHGDIVEFGKPTPLVEIGWAPPPPAGASASVAAAH